VEEINHQTFHAQVGVITKRFAEDTTSCFAAKAKTEPLHPELKIKQGMMPLQQQQDLMQ